MFKTPLDKMLLFGDPTEDTCLIPILQTENSNMSSTTKSSTIPGNQDCDGFIDVFAHCENNGHVKRDYNDEVYKWFIPVQCVLTRYRAILEHVDLDIKMTPAMITNATAVHKLIEHSNRAINQLRITLEYFTKIIKQQGYTPDNSAEADILTKMHNWLDLDGVKERGRITIRQVVSGFRCLRDDYVGRNNIISNAFKEQETYTCDNVMDVWY